MESIGSAERCHILFLDGVYIYRDNRPPRFQRVNDDVIQALSPD